MLPMGDAPIEFEAKEAKERGPKGERVIQMGMTVWNSTPCQERQMVSERWEGCKTYGLSWEQFVELHASMGRQIEWLKPLMEAGKIVAK